MLLTYTSLAGETLALSAQSSYEACNYIANAESLSNSDLLLTVGMQMLSEVALQDGDHINAALLAEGGKKGKKKKKNFTTPKHVSHKRKYNKLAILNYFTIDGEEITSRRTDCINGCPVGTKMATHKNRIYCGRCHATKFLSAPKEST